MSNIDFYFKNLPLTQLHSAPFRQSILDHHEQIVNKFFDEFWGNRKNFIHSNTSYPKMDIFEDEGYLKKSQIEMYLRDVRLYRIFEGTSEIQRLIISRNLLKGES